MSAYLASGVLSARQCVEEVMRANNNRMDTGSEGAKVWIQEVPSYLARGGGLDGMLISR